MYSVCVCPSLRLVAKTAIEAPTLWDTCVTQQPVTACSRFQLLAAACSRLTRGRPIVDKCALSALIPHHLS